MSGATSAWIMLLFIIFLNTLPVLTNKQCSTDSPALPKYNLIERCYRSKLGIVAKANFTSLSSCHKLGIAKKALALNFSPPEVRKGAEYSCEVLKCAEADGGNSLVNDSAFDYYSLYGKPLPNVNATCVPSVGMFHLVPRRVNYTSGRALCRNLTGVLPDVITEQRTDALAQALAGAGIDAVFAGWRRRNNSLFVGDRGDSMDCTTFRAWAPGHPRKNYTKYDCMLITRRKTWLSTPCKKHHKVFCELLPGGPYKRRSIFASRHKNDNDTMTKPNGDENDDT